MNSIKFVYYTLFILPKVTTLVFLEIFFFFLRFLKGIVLIFVCLTEPQQLLLFQLWAMRAMQGLILLCWGKLSKSSSII